MDEPIARKKDHLNKDYLKDIMNLPEADPPQREDEWLTVGIVREDEGACANNPRNGSTIYPQLKPGKIPQRNFPSIMTRGMNSSIKDKSTRSLMRSTRVMRSMRTTL